MSCVLSNRLTLGCLAICTYAKKESSPSTRALFLYSQSMARNCSAEASGRDMLPGLVDLGVPVGDAHTTFSSHPKIAAVKAFIDFLFLLDAEVVVRTASSFSGTAVAMKGMSCIKAKVSVQMPISGLYVCVPARC